ncbi:MAG TPA: hypothetical protein VLC09_13515 [Polyangiaceae bacterium]|nr:hypothetical protein [Polyangiaceae bacterium]
MLLVSTGCWVGCGGAAPAPEAPPPEPAPAPEPVEPTPVAEEKVEEEPSARAPASSAEPVFEPGMTVEQAVSAVPKDSQRVNIEQEVLSEPLLQPALYEPCKIRAGQHFKLRIAVWDGKVVGIDVSTTPKSAPVETCLREQLGGIRYKDKAKSLNTVEFAQ